MNITGINKYVDALKPIKGPEQGGEVQAPKTQESSFSSMFADALKEVDQLQHDANGKVEQMVKGEEANPHDAMIALEKADVAFQLMNQVRAKIIRAYEDVLRTQV